MARFTFPPAQVENHNGIHRVSLFARAFPVRASSDRVLLRVAAALFAALSVLASGPNPTRGGGETPNLPSGARELERAFQTTIEQVTPSVVGIRSQRRADDTTDDARVIVNGSGSILSADGLILTNEHVIHAADTIEVIFHDGQRTPGNVVGSDVRADLAIVRVARNGLPTVRFADADKVARGQWAIAVGNPIGLGADGNLSVSVGVVSNLQRRLPGLGEDDDRLYTDMIQTTASIHPGNSGGPLFNLAGEMIGIVTAMHARSADDDGIGFAIPLSAERRKMIDALTSSKSLAHGYLGAVVGAVDGIHAKRGVVVERVETNGPAAAAGLLVGDNLTSFDGQPITGVGSFCELISRAAPGSRASLSVERGGHPVRVEVVIQQRSIERVARLRDKAAD